MAPPKTFVSYMEMRQQDLQDPGLQNLNLNLRQYASSINSISVAQANALSLTTNTRAQRQTTPSIPASGTQAVAVYFTTPFASNNYTASVSVSDPTGFLTILNWAYLLVGVGITVNVKNNDSANAHSGTINVVAVLDT